MFDTSLVRQKCQLSIKNTYTGEYLGQALDEIDKLIALVHLKDSKIEALSSSMARTGLDISTCKHCGNGVVCKKGTTVSCIGCLGSNNVCKET